jgi:hypothetical protein
MSNEYKTRCQALIEDWLTWCDQNILTIAPQMPEAGSGDAMQAVKKAAMAYHAGPVDTWSARRQAIIDELTAVEAYFAQQHGVDVLNTNYTKSALNGILAGQTPHPLFVLPSGTDTKPKSFLCDFTHHWVRASAAMTCVVLTARFNLRKGEAADQVAQALKEAGYRPKQGGARQNPVSGKAVEKWIDALLDGKNVTLVDDEVARDAFCGTVVLFGSSGQAAAGRLESVKCEWLMNYLRFAVVWG